MDEDYPLTEQQIESYRRGGYVQLLGVLGAEQLAQARDALAAVMAKQLDARHDLSGTDAKKDKIFIQKVNLWEVDEGMRRYVLGHKLAEIARRLTGAGRVRLWHDHALVKMPGDSKASAWHQDLPYWPMAEGGALSCWMALDDVDEANGCMAFIPGSQRLGRLEPINLLDPQDIFALVPEDRREGLELRPIFQPMPAGSCTFHDGLTFHYAGPNTTDRPRRAIITIYMPDPIHYTGQPHVVTRDLPLQAGDPLAGDRFPVLAEGH